MTEILNIIYKTFSLQGVKSTQIRRKLYDTRLRQMWRPYFATLQHIRRSSLPARDPWNAKSKTLLICIPKGNLFRSSSSTRYWVSVTFSGVADRQGLPRARQAPPDFLNHIKVRSTGLHRTEGKATFLVGNLPYCSRSGGLSLTHRLNTNIFMLTDNSVRVSWKLLYSQYASQRPLNEMAA
jgi:hypothetical protein